MLILLLYHLAAKVKPKIVDLEDDDSDDHMPIAKRQRTKSSGVPSPSHDAPTSEPISAGPKKSVVEQGKKPPIQSKAFPFILPISIHELVRY